MYQAFIEKTSVLLFLIPYHWLFNELDHLGRKWYMNYLIDFDSKTLTISMYSMQSTTTIDQKILHKMTKSKNKNNSDD